MKKNRRIALFLPLVLLFTLSCTCGAPGLKDFLPNNNDNEQPQTLEITAVPPKEQPQVESTLADQQAPQSQDSGQFEIRNVNRFTSGDRQYVVGEIVSHQQTPVDYIDISMVLYDANKQVIGTESISPLLSPLFPEQSSPFVISSDAWSDMDSYEFLVNDWYDSSETEMPDLEISNHSSYSDDYSLTIVGEIVNHSAQPVQWAYVAGSLYDGSGNLLNATTAYSLLNTIQPDEKAPFKMVFYDNWQDSTDYFLQVTGSLADAEAKIGEVESYEATRDGDSCTFTGTVRNISGAETGFISVVVSMYDASDQLVDTDWTFTDSDTIPADGTDTFTLSVYDCKAYDHEIVDVD